MNISNKVPNVGEEEKKICKKFLHKLHKKARGVTIILEESYKSILLNGKHFPRIAFNFWFSEKATACGSSSVLKFLDKSINRAWLDLYERACEI